MRGHNNIMRLHARLNSRITNNIPLRWLPQARPSVDCNHLSSSYHIVYRIVLFISYLLLGIGYDSITQIVLPYAMHWKEIGILLDVDSKQLEELEQTCPNDFIRCCKEMINKWLQRDRNASQRKLFASIKLATMTPLQISLTHRTGT